MVIHILFSFNNGKQGISVSATVPEKRRKKKKSIKDPGTGAKIKTNTGNAVKTNAGPGSAVKGKVKHKAGTDHAGTGFGSYPGKS